MHELDMNLVFFMAKAFNFSKLYVLLISKNSTNPEARAQIAQSILEDHGLKGFTFDPNTFNSYFCTTLLLFFILADSKVACF